MRKPILEDQYADNGEFSHWHLIAPEDGRVLWSSFPEETVAGGQKIHSSNGVSWKKMREAFFDAHTEQRDGGVTGDFAITRFTTAPHDVFEWFKKKLQ